MTLYIVKPGDTLFAIAKRYGTTVKKLIQDNGLRMPDELVVGQVIVIANSPESIGELAVNGYIYTDVDNRVLETALPYVGIPNYGYDWPLPYVRGMTRARSIGNEEAIEIAYENYAEIQYDSTAQSPYFLYVAEDGRTHEVWFEDARSITAKLRTAIEYGLYGVGYWNLMRPFRQNWTVLSNLITIRRL